MSSGLELWYGRYCAVAVQPWEPRAIGAASAVRAVLSGQLPRRGERDGVQAVRSWRLLSCGRIAQAGANMRAGHICQPDGPGWRARVLRV